MNFEDIKHQHEASRERYSLTGRYGRAYLTVGDVTWLIAEVERLRVRTAQQAAVNQQLEQELAIRPKR